MPSSLEEYNSTVLDFTTTNPGIARVKHCEHFWDADAQARVAATLTGAVAQILQDTGGWRRTVIRANEGDSDVYRLNERARPDRNGGPIQASFRFRTSNVGKSALFFGLADVLPAASTFIEDEDGVLTTNVANAVGFMLEGEQSRFLQIVSVNQNRDGDQIVLSDTFELENNKIYVVSVLVNWQGDALLRINGEDIRRVDKAVDPAISYFASVGADARGTAYNLDVDYVDFEYALLA